MTRTAPTSGPQAGETGLPVAPDTPGQNEAPRPRPEVRCHPAIRYGQPHIGGTRVHDMAGMLWAGEPMPAVCREYGRTRPEVLVACWWLAVHGEPQWRRWATWVARHEAALARDDYDAVPDPPGRDQAAGR